jgi:hypothetical protein
LEYRHAQTAPATNEYGCACVQSEERPSSGYALVVDRQIETAEFNAHDGALKAARDLKGRFPMLQVKVYDAEKKHNEKIEIAAA